MVDAFSSRAQLARQRLETPATPSSIGSRETVEQPPPSIKTDLLADFVEEKSDSSTQTTPSPKNLLEAIRDIYDTKVIDPNCKGYVIWMSVAALAVLYNTWVIPLRATFPYQGPGNRAVWMTMDYICDFVYVVDVFLIQPRIMYLNEGFWITDMNLTRQNYYKKKHFKVTLALDEYLLLSFQIGCLICVVRSSFIVKCGSELVIHFYAGRWLTKTLFQWDKK